MLNNNKTYENSNLRDVQKTFNDGIVRIYSAKERKLIRLKGEFMFSNESVGSNQFYEAHVNNINIDRSIGVLANDIITLQDVAKIDNVFYRIVRIQYKDNNKPHWLNIVLERSVFNYEIDTN